MQNESETQTGAQGFPLDYRKQLRELTHADIAAIRAAKAKIKTVVDYARTCFCHMKSRHAQTLLGDIYKEHGTLLWNDFYANIRRICNEQVSDPNVALPVKVCVLGEDFHDYAAFGFLLRGFPDYKKFDPSHIEANAVQDLLNRPTESERDTRVFVMLLSDVPIGYALSEISTVDARSYGSYQQPLGCYGYLSRLRRINHKDTGVRFLRATSKYLMNAAIQFMRSRSVCGVEINFDNEKLAGIYASYGFRYLENKASDASAALFLASAQIENTTFNTEVTNSEMLKVLQSFSKENEIAMVLHPITSFVTDRLEDVDETASKKKKTLCKMCVKYFSDPLWDLF